MDIDHELYERLHRRIDNLPILPTVVARLMTLDRSAEDYFDQLVRLIDSEPNFAARILAVSNSAASSPRTPVASIHTAVARLGSSVSTEVVTALGVARVFVPQDKWEKSLWRHSIQVATASRALAHVANHPKVRPDECHTAGLLHDLGRFVLFQEAPELLREIDEGDWHNRETLVSLEREICGMTHGEIAELACKHWGLPPLISNVAIHHHGPTPDEPSSTTEGMVLDIVRFADLALFPSAMGDEPDVSDERLAELTELLPWFITLTTESLQAVIVESLEEANTTAAALGV
jgi:HD-like signal output (HDOD) protein